ncbi:chemotaxis protein CheC [Methanosarcina mazei]|uniref:Chemotaxis protein CheC n=3 Tax=Methanosarcina mazei TaxID=2209 RepID=A0A0F8NL16_METMZ|nr:chemotaxis protein CheC [Methanosarcina mazei]KKG05350.1 chemotaxis protein CheC [Methanosarcina mazei]KKG05561.1 chemotaxis protein CheC [Methanosarcina mazei]KKG72404.1 chemotaxis protein CheC [Methanosarcina mazei]KKG78103.1 chemotaxis protein CheC [Methanosarcina mazei]
MILMTDLDKLGEEEMDVLKELGNIGTGHAATSLSKLLNKDVYLSVPKVKVGEIKNLSREFIGEVVAGVIIALQDLEEKKSGYLYIMFPEKSARKIAGDLFGMDELDEEMYASTIMEVGNILSSSFCDASADFMNIILLPSPPSFAVDVPTAVIDSVVSQMAKNTNHIILFETSLSSDSDIKIYLALLPEPCLLDDMMKIMGRL